MKIAYVCADRGIPLLGDKGASVHLRGVTSALIRRGHEVTVICRRIEGGNPPPEAARIQPLPESEADPAAGLEDLLGPARVDVVLERYSLSSGPALAAARRLGVPFVLEVNAPLVEEAARYRGLKNIEEHLARERRLLVAADRIIAVSSGIRDHVIASGADGQRVAVIPNGVDPAFYAAVGGDRIRRRLHLEGATVIGFTGSLKPWHGVAGLLAAFAMLPRPARLLIVGEGPERPALEAAISRSGLRDRVILAGAVPHAEVPEHLAAVDIGVAPYTFQPNFYFSPLKVAEYLAAGLPVVATAQGDLPELIGEAGLLVPPGQPDSLAEALATLVADPALRARMARAARTNVAALSWDRVAERIERVLRIEVGSA